MPKKPKPFDEVDFKNLYEEAVEYQRQLDEGDIDDTEDEKEYLWETAMSSIFE